MARQWTMGEEGLAAGETKDPRTLGVNYCGGCESSRKSKYHRRVCWKVGLEHREQAALFPL